MHITLMLRHASCWCRSDSNSASPVVQGVLQCCKDRSFKTPQCCALHFMQLCPAPQAADVLVVRLQLQNAVIATISIGILLRALRCRLRLRRLCCAGLLLGSRATGPAAPTSGRLLGCGCWCRRHLLWHLRHKRAMVSRYRYDCGAAANSGYITVLTVALSAVVNSVVSIFCGCEPVRLGTILY
jgi:hypothetical protein